MTTKPQSKTNPSRTMPSARLPPEQVHKWLDDLFADDLHAKRVLSLSQGVVGVLHAAAAGIHAIGQGLAAAMGSGPRLARWWWSTTSG